MATIRLFVEDPLAPGTVLAPEPRACHYLLNVMRLRQGDSVLVFNGREGEWRAVAARIERRRLELAVEERTRPQMPEPGPGLLFAPLKRGPMEVLVEKATELGVARLVPVLVRRSAVTALKPERLRAIAIEAAEQCCRLTVPEVLPLAPLEDALESRPAGRLYVADETGRGRPALDALDAPGDLLVGPEGGFEPEELEWLRGRPEVVPIDLGPRVLRAETAALVSLVLWQSRLGVPAEAPVCGERDG